MIEPLIDVQFYDDAGQHEYFLEGASAPSVTTVLGAAGMTDYEWCKPEHRDRGTAVHKIAQLISRDWRGSTVEEIVRNSRWDPERTHPALVGYGYGCARFLLETGFRPQMVEQPIGSRVFKFCGTLDAFGPLPSGQMLLPDYKSGEPQDAAWVQMNLYDLGAKETYGVSADLVAPVWLQKDGGYKQFVPRKPGGVDLNIGLAAVSLYHWRARRKLL